MFKETKKRVVMETTKKLKTFICIDCKQKDCDVYTDANGCQLLYRGIEHINNQIYYQTKCKECILKCHTRIFIRE